jgi:uncharacterized protein (DUF885 family)
MTTLLDELAARELARTPVTAARLGAEVITAALPDMSETGIGAAAREDRQWIERLQALPDDVATEEERFDRELAISGLRTRLVLDDWQLFRRSPELYTTPGPAALRTLRDRPGTVRADDYLQQAPDILRHGRLNLDPDLADPELLRRAAVQARASAALCAGIGGRSAETAAKAYQEFAVFLVDLAERAHGDPAIGEARYTALLHIAAGRRHDAGSAHQLGRDVTRSLRAQMSALPAPSATEPAARDVAEVLQWYRAETARARRFCARHEVVTLPADDHCEVAPAGADQIALLGGVRRTPSRTARLLHQPGRAPRSSDRPARTGRAGRSRSRPAQRRDEPG